MAKQLDRTERTDRIERAVKFELNHHSYLPECEGVMWQVLQLRRDVAERMLARGGGRIITDQSEGESHAS